MVDFMSYVFYHNREGEREEMAPQCAKAARTKDQRLSSLNTGN